jgi:hypothetical protein
MLLLAVPLIAVSPLAAESANAAAASVEITAPAEGSSGYATDLTVSGRARGPAGAVFVTVEGDVNTYEASVVKGRWSTHVNELPAGPTTICAELRDWSGVVLARDCNQFTVTADPSRLEIVLPEEGSTHADSVWVVVQCVAGTTVRLTLDAGETVELPCEYWSVDRTYTGLSEGSHVVTASMVDQGVVVASATRTFTADPRDPGTVSISSPDDGSVGHVGPVTFSGVATTWNSAVYLITDGVESHITSVDGTGGWEVTVESLAVGSHTICAAVKDPNFEVEAQDCITYTVEIDPSLLTINSPAEGSVSAPYVVQVDGGCAEGTTVSITLDGGQPSEQHCYGWYVQEYYSLTDGAHTVSVTMLHDGEVITTKQRSFAVDAAPPASPVVTSPATKRIITEATLPLVGTADPSSTIEVLTGDEMASWFTSAADDGTWQLTLDSAFFEASGALGGQRTRMTVKVVASDQFGNRSAPSTYTYTVHIR